MKLNHDPQADAIYIYLSSKPYAYGKDLDDQRRIDYASDDTPNGVELLSVSRGVIINGLPRVQEMASLLEANSIKTYCLEEATAINELVFANFTRETTHHFLQQRESKAEEITEGVTA